MPADVRKTTGYLVDVVTRESLEFQYNPDDIADDKSTDYAAVQIPGMSHPRYQYVSGKPRKIAFKVKLFKCFLDAGVSEQIARMVSMKAATENADEMIGMLSTAYNRARQGQITGELLEIIGGAEALNE